MNPGGDVFERVRLGTRGSRLSLWQANHVAKLIRDRHGDCHIEIKIYRTRGDENQKAALPLIGGKGLFTEALEDGLRRRDIDVAVHSLKDLPVGTADGLAIGAIPKRGDHRDVLLSRSGATLEQLPAGARLGTGSLRRRAQLLALRPDLQMAGIRGNVPTRVDKLLMRDGPYDALVLAAAGLNRLGLTDHISEVLDSKQMISAAGQGALAIQCRDDRHSLAFLARLTDLQTAQAVEAERTFLHALGGGCALPVGAYAYVQASALQMRGRVTSLDGSRQIDVTGECPALARPGDLSLARKLGERLAQEALNKGARLILDNIAPGELSVGEE